MGTFYVCGSYLFIHSDLTCVTFVLPKGNQREAGSQSNAKGVDTPESGCV